MTTLAMPKLGLTMTEGLLVEWKQAPGAAFRAGDLLFIVETDKIANEIEAEADGVLSEILVPAGSVVPVGTPLARLGSTSNPARVVATPLARRLARERGIDLAGIAGSGPQGRIKAADVTARPATPPSVEPAPQAASVRMEGTQATIARRLQEAKREIPHFYLSRPAELDALLALKAEVDAQGDWGRTTVTHWLLAAIGRALADDPTVDRVWSGDGIVPIGSSDVGLAVDSERGLYVPVVRAAGRRSLGALAAEANALADRARAGRLSATDSGGGSISLSNLGMFGVASVTPIINPGQAMILGVGAIQALFRPDGEGAPRAVREATLVLAADHRVVNGAAAARFLGRIVAYLEAPLKLLTPPVGRNP